MGNAIRCTKKLLCSVLIEFPCNLFWTMMLVLFLLCWSFAAISAEAFRIISEAIKMKRWRQWCDEQ